MFLFWKILKKKNMSHAISPTNLYGITLEQVSRHKKIAVYILEIFQASVSNKLCNFGQKAP